MTVKLSSPEKGMSTRNLFFFPWWSMHNMTWRHDKEENLPGATITIIITHPTSQSHQPENVEGNRNQSNSHLQDSRIHSYLCYVTAARFHIQERDTVHFTSSSSPYKIFQRLAYDTTRDDFISEIPINWQLPNFLSHSTTEKTYLPTTLTPSFVCVSLLKWWELWGSEGNQNDRAAIMKWENLGRKIRTQIYQTFHFQARREWNFFYLFSLPLYALFGVVGI